MYKIVFLKKNYGHKKKKKLSKFWNYGLNVFFFDGSIRGSKKPFWTFIFFHRNARDKFTLCPKLSFIYRHKNFLTRERYNEVMITIDVCIILRNVIKKSVV